MTTEGLALFMSMALAAFKSTHKALPVAHEDLIGEVVAAFGLDELADHTAEIQRFMQWIPNWKYSVILPTVDRVCVGLQIPFGGGYVNMSLQAGFPIVFGEDDIPTTQADQKLINATTVDLFKKVFTAYEGLKSSTAFSAGGTLPETRKDTPQQPANSQGERQQFKASSMSVEFRDGKKIVRIKAGWFMAFGAPVYEEVLSEAGIDINSLAMGEVPFTREIIIQKSATGKPKVVKII